MEWPLVARSGHKAQRWLQLWASAANAAGRSRARNEQRLHALAACHEGIRRLEALAHFSLTSKRATTKASFRLVACRSATSKKALPK